MKPIAQTFNPRNLPIKEEIEKDNGTPTDTTLSYDDQKGYTYVYREDASLVESTRPDQDHIGIERKQAELSEMIVTKQARSLLPSHKPPMFSGDVMSYSSFIAGVWKAKT